VCVVGFATIGIVWLNHNAQSRYIDSIKPGVVTANLLVPSFVALLRRRLTREKIIDR
jgi:uncharacterized membrane protein